jgi:mRNA-degrading endonuclease RelE of RelBE toxin-antitoxin system
MADKVAKFLRKLSGKKLDEVERTMELILANRLSDLDIKKLKGHDDFYRVRVGRIRIIFARHNEQNIIVDTGWRDDKTYRDF